MLFDIIILIGIIAVIVGRHNSKGTTHELQIIQSSMS